MCGLPECFCGQLPTAESLQKEKDERMKANQKRRKMKEKRRERRERKQERKRAEVEVRVKCVSLKIISGCFIKNKKTS